MERKEELLRKFGKQLTALRKQKGLSIRDLAVAAGLQTAQVQRIEAGEVDLWVTTILRLARALEIPPSELVVTL